MKRLVVRFVIYALVTAGAVTMVFPFLWMLSTSFKSSLEVLSTQINLVPELKKYLRVGTELIPVEFKLAVDLEREISDYEGRITSRLLGEKYLNSLFGRELSAGFTRLRQRLQEVFRRYRSLQEVRAALESIWAETIAPISSSGAAAEIPEELGRELNTELAGLRQALDRLTESAEYRSDSLPVVILSGMKRGKEEVISLSALVFRRFLFDNFRKAWESAPFARYFLNTIFIALAVTAGQVLTSALAAYAFARMQFRFKEAIFMVLLGTMMVPHEVILIPDYVIISKLGWINTYLALIIPFIGAVFGTYFMRQHFETLPQDLFDAASIDGCGRLRTLFQIVLPLSRSVLITVAIFTFIMTWNSLLWPLVMTNTPEMRPLQVGLAVFNQESGTEWELLMAASTFSIFPLLVIFFIAQKQFIEGITRSGLKD